MYVTIMTTFTRSYTVFKLYRLFEPILEPPRRSTLVSLFPLLDTNQLPPTYDCA